MRRLHERLAARFHRARASAMAGSVFNGVVGLIFVLGTGAALGLSAALYGAGAITLGTVYLVFRYTGMLRQPLERLSRQMNSFQQATGGIVRVRELLATERAGRRRAGRDASRTARCRSSSTASRSPTRPSRSCATSRAASSRARCSACSAGPARARRRSRGCCSACTTRPRAPSASAAPTCASARLDALRGAIGLVTQDVQLFQGTLRDNVTLFDRTVPDARLREVFAELGLDEWLRAPAGRARHAARRRRPRAVGRRGAARRAGPGVPEGPRPGRPRRGVVAARPGTPSGCSSAP